MSNRCKFCFSRTEDTVSSCNICGIETKKSKEELTWRERKVRNACTLIRVVGLFYIIFGVILIGVGLSVVFGLRYRQAIPGSLFGLFLLGLGFSLREYRYWSYYGAMIVPLIMIMLTNTGESVNPSAKGAGFLICIGLWYGVGNLGNRTARNILLRRRCPKCRSIDIYRYKPKSKFWSLKTPARRHKCSVCGSEW